MRDELQIEANKWWAVSMFTNVMSNCAFTTWVMVVLVITNAPKWAWVVGCCYALSHWVYLVSFWLSHYSMKKLRDATPTNTSKDPTEA